MKKEDLVSKGLTEEHAQIAVDLWNEAMKGFVPKERLDEVSGKLKEANTTIETLKKDNQDNAELQKQVNTYKDKADLQKKVKDYEVEVAGLKTAAANTKKEYALKEKLAAAGVLDADYLIYKRGGVDKFTFDKEGVPVGLDDILKPMKEASPHLFKADPGAFYKPNGGGNPPAANPWKAETYNLTEQGRIYKENPAMAKQLASAAGATI